jgi:hypothetical protein
MNETPAGQMLWKLEDNERVLMLRHNALEKWRPYEEFPQYALNDPIGFSKGITTFLALLKKGWIATKS